MAKSIMQARPWYGKGFSGHPSWRNPFKRIWSMWNWGFQGPPDPMTLLMQRRMREVQRGEYDALGTILQLCTLSGWIIFPTNKGPSLGRFHSDSQVDLIDAWEWDGLPDWWEQTAELCPDCRAWCEECTDEGQPLRIQVCGEERSFEPGTRPCIYGNQLQCCGGSGVISAQEWTPCPACGSSGAVHCRRCAGTGKMSTGKTAEGKFCGSCGGTARQRIHQEQPLEKHLIMGEYIPVMSLMLSGPDKCTQIWVGKPDDQGSYPHLVNRKNFQCGSRAVILGGVLRHDQAAAPRRRRGREYQR